MLSKELRLMNLKATDGEGQAADAPALSACWAITLDGRRRSTKAFITSLLAEIWKISLAWPHRRGRTAHPRLGLMDILRRPMHTRQDNPCLSSFNAERRGLYLSSPPR